MTGPFQEARLKALLLERQKRRPAEPIKLSPFNPFPLCHTGQLEAVSDASPTQAWVTTRRAGKTTGACFLLLAAATSAPNVNALYLSTTIKRAISTLWDELLRLNREHGLGGVPNCTRYYLRMPNGSKVWVSGCETKKEANAWRGVLPRTAIVFVDEGQDWPADLLLYTYLDVVIPSLSDIGGRFVLAGTPGGPRGFFYDFHLAKDVSRHSWSLFDNPHVKNARQLMEQAMSVRGCDETDPSIQREFFAKFCYDTQRQIFLYDDAKNGYDPPDLPRGEMYYGIAADFGTVDQTAVHVWGYRNDNKHLWMIDSVAKDGLGASAQVSLVKEVAAKYRSKGKVIGIVGDPGGGGKGVIEDFNAQFDAHMDPAAKANKAAACMTMRDGLRNGTIRIPRDAKTFISELQIPEWDPDDVGKSIKGHMPDRIDAALYGYRLMAKFHRYKPSAPPLNAEERFLASLDEQSRRRDAADQDLF